MKSIFIKINSKRAIDKAVTSLKKSLKKGDIILTGPIAKNFFFKYFNIIARFSKIVLRGITHSCLYLGKGNDFERITLKQLITNKINNFGGLTIYAVQPRDYKNKHRNLVIKEITNNFLKKSKHLAFSYFEAAKTTFRYLFQKSKFYKNEDLSFQKKWNCSHIVAHILKKANAPIGKRTSYTFVPCTFVFSRYFKVKSKVI